MRFNRRSMFRAGAATVLALSTPQIMTRAALCGRLAEIKK